MSAEVILLSPNHWSPSVSLRVKPRSPCHGLCSPLSFELLRLPWLLLLTTYPRARPLLLCSSSSCWNRRGPIPQTHQACSCITPCVLVVSSAWRGLPWGGCTPGSLTSWCLSSNITSTESCLIEKAAHPISPHSLSCYVFPKKPSHHGNPRGGFPRPLADTQMHGCSSVWCEMVQHTQPPVSAGPTPADEEGPQHHESRDAAVSPEPISLPGM